ncbi:hypothetical protein ACFL1S_03570 [Pseudomonadota bacterium]
MSTESRLLCALDVRASSCDFANPMMLLRFHAWIRLPEFNLTELRWYESEYPMASEGGTLRCPLSGYLPTITLSSWQHDATPRREALCGKCALFDCSIDDGMVETSNRA